MSWVLKLRCDAFGCPSSYKTDPTVKFFSFPCCKNEVGLQRTSQWVNVVGGVKNGSLKRKRFLCQYHFPADQFRDHTRTGLIRGATPAFPFGPINPITKDYCPAGTEPNSVTSHEFLRSSCCVPGCPTFKESITPLHEFPSRNPEVSIWAKRIGINLNVVSVDHVKQNYRVCHRHFPEGSCSRNAEKNVLELKIGSLPSLHLPGFSEPDSRINPFEHSTLQSNEIQGSESITFPPEETNELKNTYKNKLDSCINDKENDDQRSAELKRKTNEKALCPAKKMKENQDTLGTNQPLLLPIENFNADVVVAHTQLDVDSVSDEGCSGIGVPDLDDVEFVVYQLSPETTNPPSSRSPDIARATNIFSTKTNSVYKKVRYWSPSDFTESGTCVSRSRKIKDGVNKLEFIQQQASETGKDNFSSFKPSYSTNSSELNVKKREVVRQGGSYSTIQRGENNSENDARPSEGPKTSKEHNSKVLEKINSLDTALLQLFNSCQTNEDNVFSCLSNPPSISDHDESEEAHTYCSSASLNVIKSAAELCEFNSMKVKQLERLIGEENNKIEELENVLIKHLSSVLCLTGIDFLKKCFDKVIQDAISKKKQDPPKCADITSSSDEIFSEDMKKLAVALQAHSGKAYHAMGQIIDLPSSNKVRDWATYADGSPGFSKISFQIIRDEARRCGRYALIVNLSVEEMPLKKDVSWDGENLFGYADLGYGRIDNDQVLEASKVIIFYATALNRSWKLPLGYCLADHLSAQVRANLVIQYLVKLDSVGVRCIALVANYSLFTYQMFQELGVNVEDEFPQSVSFAHPISKGDRVFCFADIFQLLKSVKNLLLEKKMFQYKHKDIKWPHINCINDILDEDNLDCRLNRPGFENVVTDLLSLKSAMRRDPSSFFRCTSKILSLLKNLAIKELEDSSETIRFFEKLNCVVELFSSCHLFDEGDRKPISRSNLNQTLLKLNNLNNYFSSLTYKDGVKILTAERKLPIILLCLNILSLRGLLRRVFSNDKYQVNFVLTEKLNLGNVSCMIREFVSGGKSAMTGLEFKSAFNELVKNLSVAPSEVQSNVTLNEPRQPVKELCLGFSNTFSYFYTPLVTISERAHEFFTENVIENWLETSNCADCSHLILEGLKNYSNYQASENIIRDIHKMLRRAETVLNELEEIPIDSFNSWFNIMANKTLNSLTSVNGFKSYNHLFNSSGFGEVSHFTVMVKDMLRIFLRFRLCFLRRQEKIKIKDPLQKGLRFFQGRSWA